MDDQPLALYPLFVLLDVYGRLFFAPGFSESFDNYLAAYPAFEPGATHVEVIPEFLWPENAGSAENIIWIAALTNPEITEIAGDIGTFTFSWE